MSQNRQETRKTQESQGLQRTHEQPEQQPQSSPVSRRAFVSAAAVAGIGLAGAQALTAQTRAEAKAGRTGNNASDPGEENKGLLDENPNSNQPPATDHGDVGAIWYSFDLTKKRLQGGGWTHQVTDRELPPSKDLAGVNMRLTSGSFRELHWHTSDEWAYMITGEARVTLLQTDGKISIDDVKAGDLWYFAAGLPYSIQGLGKDGCEFLLVFNDGHFSEDETFLLSDWLAHTPPEVVQKNMGWTEDEFNKLPPSELYIFQAPLPKSLEEDRAAAGTFLETEKKYTYKLADAPPTITSTGGEVRIVDSTNFPVARDIAAGLVRIKPGGIREMHWHPTGSEWQFYLAGKGRMTVFMPGGKARTMDFRANDVGFVPALAGHYIENTGTEDLLFLEMFKAPKFEDVSLNNWIRRIPAEMAEAHLRLTAATIAKAPAEKHEVLPA